MAQLLGRSAPSRPDRASFGDPFWPLPKYPGHDFINDCESFWKVLKRFHFGVVFVDLSVLHLLVIPSFFSVVRLSLLILLLLTLILILILVIILRSYFISTSFVEK